jgi:hypothetical protein
MLTIDHVVHRMDVESNTDPELAEYNLDDYDEERPQGQGAAWNIVAGYDAS